MADLNFALDDTDSDAPLKYLQDGATITFSNLTDTTNVFVEVDPTGALAGLVRSLRLTLSDGTVKYINKFDNSAPFTLFGDRGKNLLNGVDLAPGGYQLEVEAFSRPAAKGTSLGTHTINFSVSEAPNVAPTATPIDAGAVPEDAAAVVIDLLADANAADSDGGTLGVSNVVVLDGGAAPVVFELAGSVLTIDPAQFAAALAADESTTLSISYEVTDGQGGVTANTGQLVVDGLDGPFTW